MLPRRTLKKIFYLFLISFCFHPILWAQQNIGELLSENAFPLEINDSEFLGEGADSLLKAIHNSEILLFGENHGVKEIANFAQVLYKELNSVEPRIFITEIGPATAAQTEIFIRSSSFRSFLSKGINLHSVPFFFLEDEIPLLEQAVWEFDIKSNSIWGLDQEFIAGGPIVFHYLENLAETDEEKNAVRKVKRAQFFNPFLIGMGSGKALQKLESAFSNSTNRETKDITKQLLLSHQIYKEQMGGNARWSNETRETLMMDNFLNYAEAAGDSIPPLFFKFGAYHLHKGASPTVSEALGFQIDTWATKRDWTTTNIFVDALGGNTLDALFGREIELPSTATWSRTPFPDYVDNQPVLFDLESLKNHPELDELPRKVRIMIQGYDYLLIFPTATAASFAEGRLVTHVYVPIIIALAVLMIAGFIFLVVKVVRKMIRRRKLSRSMA